MQTEHKESGGQFGPNVICPNCRSEMVAGLRFCRMCGFRLGEGVEEYTDTRRFNPQAPPFAAPPAAQKEPPPFSAAGAWAPPMAPLAPMAAAAPPAAAWRWTNLLKPWRMGWVGWVVLSLVIMVVIGTAVNNRERRATRGPERPVVSVEREVDGFQTADGGGAFISGLDGPNTTLEAAGLRGGDTIISFDGKSVRDARALRRILRETPPGKTVEVVYIRDGQTATTALTVAAADAYRGLRPLEERPGGTGRINVDLGERVRVPSLGVHGVELDGVSRNGPADLAGLKEDDIVVEFNGKPTATPGDLRLRIYEAVPGETVTAVVVRDGQRIEIPVKVGRSRD
jgi:membrane-associated protease RseP (regulator of RpoE activity)